MFFNINDNPYLMATQEAIRSRFAILPFGKTFVKNANPFYGEIEADPRFKEDPEFIKSQIAPAMVNKLLDALSRLMSEGIDYSPLDEAMKDVQREDNHLWDFAEETGLSYSENPSDFLPIEDIYLKLRKWYMNEGILSSGYSGDQWIDPDRPGDKWIKASRSVGGKILELFPKAKKAKIRTGENRATKSGLIGVSFSLNEEGGCQMDGKRMAKRMANGIAETPSMTQVDGKDPKFSKRLDSESIKEIKERDFQEKEGEGENNEKLEKNLFLNLGHLPSTDAAARVSAVPFDIHLASNLTSTPALAHTVKNILVNATKPKKLDDLLLLVQTRLKWEVLTAQELEHALVNLVDSGEIEKVDNGYQLGKF
jgi:putative DNA primase/helicase